MYTFYYAAESPACRSYDGWALPVAPPAQAWCCRYGVELSVAVLPVETFTGCHDGLRDMMEVVMREAGTDVRSEPADIFASLIDPQVLARPGQSPAIRPDLQATLSMPAVATACGQRVRASPSRRAVLGQQSAPGVLGHIITPSSAHT